MKKCNMKKKNYHTEISKKSTRIVHYGTKADNRLLTDSYTLEH